MSADKGVEFISDRMSIKILRGRWCHIVLDVHATTKDKIDYVKDSFYQELEHMFDKYHMKNSLGDFNSKVGKEDILKSTIVNASLHEISSDIGVGV
jgi:hypothetical protein